MAPLFFALASSSSDASGSGLAGPVLLPGAPGWQSARGCSYPQALLLQLERPADIQSVEITARGDLTPRAVDVQLSRGADVHGALQDFSFETVGTVRFDGASAGTPRCTPRRGTPVPRREALRLLALCSGQVRLLVHEPLVASGPGNPYRQVGLSAVDIYGHELSAVPGAPRGSAQGLSPPSGSSALGGGGDEVALVLLELGVPLDLVPFELDADRSGAVDAGTKELLEELQGRRERLLEALRHIEAERLEEHIRHLGVVGASLRNAQLELERERSRDGARAQVLAERVQKLEQQRLSIAALYETDFWLKRMVLPPKEAPGGPAA